MAFGFFGGAKKRAAELHKASRNGDLDGVLQALQKGADINALDPNGYDALVYACVLQNADLASLLVRNGADIKRRYTILSSQGSVGNHTALSVVASKGCYEICKLLLENGAELDVVTDAGSTPFMWALTNGASEQVALLLLEAGANPDPNITPSVSFGIKTSPLILASTNGMNKVVAKLLAKNVHIDATDGDSATALKQAAHSGHEAIVGMLLEAGASANIADFEGWTPLIAAASKGHFAICRRLIDGGADINVQSDSGDTALGQVVGVRADRRVGDPVAALRRRFLGTSDGGDESVDDGVTEDNETLEMARLMLEKGASPKVTAGPEKELLIDVATNLNDQPLLDLLLSFGAELGARQGDQMVIAASHYNIDRVKELLESGVDVDHLDGDGDTALGICVLKLCTQELEQKQIRDLFELIGLLLEHDANVDVEGCRIAPLPMVARLGSLNLVNAFLRAGADQDAVLTEPDPDAGKTALEVAQEGGHDDIVAALLEAQQGG